MNCLSIDDKSLISSLRCKVGCKDGCIDKLFSLLEYSSESFLLGSDNSLVLILESDLDNSLESDNSLVLILGSNSDNSLVLEFEKDSDNSIG